jgi:TonB family protein
MLLAVLVSVPMVARLQPQIAPSSSQVTASKYSNSTEGLRQLLQDVRATAKSGDMKRVAAFLRDMEIPDCAVWLHKIYEADRADSWMGLCDAKTLSTNEKSMEETFSNLAKEEGEIVTRKVNDSPQPGKGLEWGWLQAIRQPLDIYFAAWKRSTESEDSKGKPIGYFMFIDGGFRWESGIRFGGQIKTITGKFLPAQLVKRVEPIYPQEAAAQHISGTVRVYYVIGGDGAVYNAHAISGEGLSDDPLLRKAAEEAVIQWRYQPATLNGKPIQTNAVTVDIVFAPKN